MRKHPSFGIKWGGAGKEESCGQRSRMSGKKKGWARRKKGADGGPKGHGEISKGIRCPSGFVVVAKKSNKGQVAGKNKNKN